MRCAYCNEKLAVHDLWCTKCGKRTDILGKDLAALKSLNQTWKEYKKVMGQNFPVGIWSVLIGILPMGILLWLFNFALPELPKWQLMLIRNLAWLLFLPVLLVPFRAVCRKDNLLINVKEFFGAFGRYASYWIFSLTSVIFYLVIYYVCKGDPILNLVWLALVLYWIAIVIPVPILMERYNLNAWKSVKMAYKYAGDVRWNIFLMAIVLTLANLVAALFLVIGLAVTVPFTWFAIRDFVDKLITYEVFTPREAA